MAEKLEVIIGAKDQFSSTFDKLKGAIVGLVAAYAGIKTVRAVAGIFKDVADEADRFSKLSDRLGYTTETISRLSYAAQLAKIDFDTLSRSMQYTLRVTGEAAAGSESLRETIDRLGLSLDRLVAMRSDEQFIAYADALAAVKNPAEQAAIAMEIFGRGGAEMLQMLRNGSDGLREMMAEAERFGVVVSQQSAVNAAEFNDSLTRMGAAIDGVKKAIVDGLLPYFTAAFNRMAGFIADNKSIIVNWADSAAGAFSTVVKAAIYAGAGIADAWKGLRLMFYGLVYSVADLGLAMKSLAGYSTDLAVSFMEWVNKNVWSDFFKDSLVSMRQFRGEIQLQTADILRFQSEVLSKMEDIAKGGLSIDAVTAFYDSVREELNRLQTEGMGKIKTPEFAVARIGLTDKMKTEIESLKRMWEEYYLTEAQRVDSWYAEQQRKYKGHKEALAMIDQIYMAKKWEAVSNELKADNEKYEAIKRNQDHLFSIFENEIMREEERLKLWYEQQIAMAEENQATIALINEIYAERAKALDEARLQEQLNIYADFLGGMAALAGAAGKKMFVLYKALSIGEAIMSTYAGAARAMKDHPYPYNMIAAAAVIAYGLAQVAKIAAQKPPEAKRGLDFVPADETYKLHRGERVVPAETNRDLKEFLARGGAGAGISIGNIEISFPNVRSADDLRSMSDREWQDILEERMIPNMRRLAGAGIVV